MNYNNPSLPADDDDDYLRAAEWLDQLSEQPLDELSTRRFLLWMEAKPGRRALFERLVQTWNDPALTRAAKAVMKQTTATSSHFTFTPWRAGFAFSLCLCVAIAASFKWFGTDITIVAPVPIATNVGIRHDVQLADGSQLEVGPASQVSVLLGEQRREIALEQGMAYFRVAKDKSRPFEVRIDNASVVAVGTEFNIDKTATRIEVTVYEGAVEVRDQPAHQAQLLRAGERALIGTTGIQRLTVDLQQLVDWRSGWLEVANGELGQLLEQLNRYSQHPIRLPDPELGHMPIAGRFHLKDAPSTLQLLTELYDLQLHTRTNQGKTELQLTRR
ncbi:MAG: hypothetical protein B0W54_13810 [Cellvibrio sp. 79]|nr:MAG: hypothetical protein B0W54_13810 [Cellvibrio sp. 79]